MNQISDQKNHKLSPSTKRILLLTCLAVLGLSIVSGASFYYHINTSPEWNERREGVAFTKRQAFEIRLARQRQKLLQFFGLQNSEKSS